MARFIIMHLSAKDLLSKKVLTYFHSEFDAEVVEKLLNDI
jgi:hypothetical protein